MKLVYQYLMARFLSLITLMPSSKSSHDNENYAFWSRISWSALSYHLYTLQTILFRTETVAIICIVVIVALILHSIFHYRERNRSVESAPLYAPLSSQSPKPYYFAKLFRCFNFTILFSNVFALVDSTFRNFRSSEAVVNQQSYGHSGVYSMQGRRPNMEDCFTLKNNVAKDLGIDYYAVYDGHGGPVCCLFSFCVLSIYPFICLPY